MVLPGLRGDEVNAPEQYARVMERRLSDRKRADRILFAMPSKREALARAVVEIRLARLQRIAGNPRAQVILTLKRAARAREVYLELRACNE